MMTTLSSQEVTQMLLDCSDGDKAAFDRLMPVVYQELRRRARYHMRQESPGHSLQTADLVNEVYLKLVDYKKMRWQNRAHFFAVAAQAMRRILVEHARRRRSAKRGGGKVFVPPDDAVIVSPERSDDVIALEDALIKLETLDARRGRVVELRFFGGLTEEEIAEVMEISIATVRREWRAAKAWLYHEISEGPLDGR